MPLRHSIDSAEYVDTRYKARRYTGYVEGCRHYGHWRRYAAAWLRYCCRENSHAELHTAYHRQHRRSFCRTNELVNIESRESQE